MMRLPKTICTILFIIATMVRAVADEQYNIYQTSISDGLLSHSIGIITKDQAGTIWLGSTAGINRICGDEIKAYTNSGSSKGIATPNYARCIICDKYGTVWAVIQGYAYRYNPKTDNFNIITNNDNSPLLATAISEVEDGIIFGSFGQIQKYSFNTKLIETIFQVETPLNFNIYFIKQVDQNRVLISNNSKGTYVVDLKSGETTLIDTPIITIVSTGILLDSNGLVWIPNSGEGVKCYNIDGESPQLIRSYTPYNSQLNNDTPTYIYESQGKIWVTTDGGGINIIDPLSEDVTLLKTKPNKNEAFLLSSRTLLRDGDTWYVGSVKGGLLTLQESFTDNYTPNPYNTTLGPSYPSVNACLEQSDGKIWLGTDGDGLNLFDPKSKQFTQIKSTEGKKIITIVNFGEEQLLIYSYSEGLFLFDKLSHKLTPIECYNSEITRLKVLIETIPIDEDTVLILGWQRLIYNHKQNSLKQISIKGDNSNSIIRYNYNNNGTRKIAYSTENIYEIFNNADGDIEVISIFNESNDIQCATLDQDDNVWFCDSDGLKMLTPDSPEEYAIHHSANVPISSMLCDKSNQLWMSSSRGIFSYSIDQNRSFHFGFTHGIEISDFLPHSNLIHSSGDIFFGGLDGLLCINSNIPQRESLPTEPTIIAIKVDNQNHHYDIKDSLPALTLPHDFASIDISVAIKGFNILERHKITYNIESNSYKNIVENFDNKLHIPTLPPNKYKISVSYIAPDGVTTEPITIATLTVKAPVWQRWWMILIYIILVGGVVVSIIIITINRKKRKLQWLLNKNEKKLADEKVRFMINISHELRTPLTLIYAPIKRLLQSNDLTNTTRESLTKVFSQAQNTFNLVNMVLDVRKLEVSNHTLSLELVDLNSWTKAIVNEFVDEFRINGIELRSELEPNISNIYIDQKLCKSVLSNLLMNAQKHTARPGIVVVKSSLEGNYAKISVVDDGMGIAPQDLNSLCDRFYQSNHNNVGYGIGLSYAKEIIELHNGTLGVMNNDDRGATFFFELPLESSTTAKRVGENESVAPSMPTLPQYSSGQNISTFDTSKLSILVVDDNNDIIEMLTDLFSTQFKTVYSASNGVEALSVITNNLPDIIISDVMMPQMDGFELCKELKNNIAISHIPIILLTARGDIQSTILGNKMGADNYISKPFDPELLLCVITNELRKRATIKEHFKLSDSTIDPAIHTYSNADYNFMEQINEFINCNLANEELGLEMILSHIGMSRTSFKNKLFAITDTNINISQYINNFRIERAKLLITTTDTPISDIAYMVGFSSATYFSTAFKKQTGQSPKNYKQSL